MMLMIVMVIINLINVKLCVCCVVGWWNVGCIDKFLIMLGIVVCCILWW